MQKEITKQVRLTKSEMVIIKRQLGLVDGAVQYQDAQPKITSILAKIK